MPTYGGDEVSAVVLDIGSSTTRGGYAGEDTPKVVIPTSYGYIPASKQPEGAETQASYYFGDHGPTLWRANMEVVNPLKESMVEDWSAIGKLMKVVFDREMRLGLPGADLEPDERRGILTEHPLLVTEPSWNSKENRERMIEIAFEEFDTPAYYSVDRSVMAAFAAGKGTAVVVDIGDDLTTVTPISDGFVLRKGIRKSPIAGNVLSSLLLSTTEHLLPTPIYPHYLIASKDPQLISQQAAGNPSGGGDADADTAMSSAADEVPPGVVLRDDRLPGKEGSKTTESFMRYQKMRIMHELKESICEVFPRTWEEETLSAMPVRTFEFPSGQTQQYGRERYAIPEVLFNPAISPWPLSKHVGARHGGSTIGIPETPLPLSHLLLESIAASDIDIQPTLNCNIILTGASSLIPGLIDRLDSDLRAISPATKFKLSAPGNLAERKFASWLGGSILASLGSFHQLWIGKDEYKEQGRSVVHRRCK
ncbi:hypothetical protein PCASD_10724 [Puccinia coronata f. sp. avenae]|uniref:Actin-related protein 4 n=1 Tax=Puccinia coronata f. sp. avenae TaxID=200324 RepID=A0A2N5UPW2_9BASI|nr:hypothetical protein PCASD_10724 [Puccinia coronata f. sp. avenae]